MRSALATYSTITLVEREVEEVVEAIMKPRSGATATDGIAQTRVDG